MRTGRPRHVSSATAAAVSHTAAKGTVSVTAVAAVPNLCNPRGMVLIDAEGREHVGAPIKFALEPGRPHLSVPQLGEHNREVLGS